MFYILTRDDCPWCDKAMDALDKRGEPYEAFLYTEHPMLVRLLSKAGLKTVPQIWHEKEYIGGCSELYAYLDKDT